MSTPTDRMPLGLAWEIAARVVAELRPHCERIEVAGSLRRQRQTIGDIEIVCIPNPYEATPLFRSGIALVVEQWEKVKGELPCRYTQRVLPEGIKLDLFMPDPRGWGLQLAIRTGSAEWAHHVLAAGWVKAGFHSKEGLLRDYAGRVVPTPSERALFDLIGLPWVAPEEREWRPA